MGTATTFDVVDSHGAFVGGAIAAGAGLGLEALPRGTAQLPRVPLPMPPHAIGRDTVSGDAERRGDRPQRPGAGAGPRDQPTS